MCHYDLQRNYQHPISVHLWTESRTKCGREDSYCRIGIYLPKRSRSQESLKQIGQFGEFLDPWSAINDLKLCLNRWEKTCDPNFLLADSFVECLGTKNHFAEMSKIRVFEKFFLHQYSLLRTLAVQWETIFLPSSALRNFFVGSFSLM